MTNFNLHIHNVFKVISFDITAFTDTFLIDLALVDEEWKDNTGLTESIYAIDKLKDVPRDHWRTVDEFDQLVTFLSIGRFDYFNIIKP